MTKCDRGGRGSKIVQICVTSFMNDPLVKGGMVALDDFIFCPIKLLMLKKMFLLFGQIDERTNRLIRNKQSKIIFLFLVGQKSEWCAVRASKNG